VRCLPLLALASCAPLGRGDLEHLDVARASLRDVRLGTVGIVFGGTDGSGELEIVTTAGDTVVVPVHVGGGMVGAAMEIGATIDPTNAVELDLPPEPITADQLLGTYWGVSEAIVLGVGASDVHLENKHGVQLDKAWLSAGLGIMVDVRWLRLRVDDAEAGADTGAPEDEETGDTAPPPVDTPDDTGGSGAEERGDGCRGGCCGASGGMALVVGLAPWWVRRRRW
jgi:hypothetical protein